MFCKYCGTKLIDDAAFCHECGKSTFEQPVTPPPAPPVPPVYQEPVSRVQIVYQASVPPAQPAAVQNVPPVQYTYTIPGQPVTPVPQPSMDPVQLENLAQQTLTFGILGLCLSLLGVPGIIFSSIGGKKANTFKKMTGELTGKALTGYRLAKAGKIVSIIMTVVLTLVVLTLQDQTSYEFTNPFEYFEY